MRRQTACTRELNADLRCGGAGWNEERLDEAPRLTKLRNVLTLSVAAITSRMNSRAKTFRQTSIYRLARRIHLQIGGNRKVASPPER